MIAALRISESMSFREVARLIFNGPADQKLEFSEAALKQIDRSHQSMYARLERREPIYGVTTGFGDSNHRRIDAERSSLLQENLIRYLSCGTGPILRKPVRRAVQWFRLLSLSRGLSGVSRELVEHLTCLVENDLLPLIPAEGSLGASGDLIPLAYIAGVMQGWGEVETPNGVQSTAAAFAERGIKPYLLKPKEGLAMVNGTSAMVGQAYVNVTEFRALAQLAEVETAWLCLALDGRPEAFGPLVNEQAKRFDGQGKVARHISSLLAAESYEVEPFSAKHGAQETPIQDRYSLRCAPQILGPIVDTLNLVEKWVELEINGVSDNPLFDPEDNSMASGGNFYGGYLSQGMDYLKISISHAADLLDRQVALVIDEKSNRGLPANLANWPGLPPEEKSLHHGLKGLHQATSAITSEIIAKSFPNGVLSRSTESHNQDKVSLGMSAALECEAQLDKFFRVHALALVCLTQAIDLKKITLRGERSRFWYDLVRAEVPFVERDQALDKGIMSLASQLRHVAHTQAFQS